VRKDKRPEGLPQDDAALELFVERATNDTGFFARHVLGMNRDGDSGERGTGGIQSHGPHQESIQFLDDEAIEYGTLMTPRKTFKSSKVEAAICRRVIKYPNRCQLLVMEDLGIAEERLTAIRGLLSGNEIISYLWGKLEGRTWRKDRFVVGSRTNHSLLDPTLQVSSTEDWATGGHFHYQYFDDIVTKQMCRTPNGIQRSIDTIINHIPLRADTICCRNIGTPYADNDAHWWAMNQVGWKHLVRDIGPATLVEQEDGKLDVVGEIDWQCLPRDYLRSQIALGYSFFMSQYKLTVVGGQHQTFRRTQFRPVSWSEEMRNLTGYLLTDVATARRGTSVANSTKRSLNVLAYVCLDEKLRMTIMDVQIGHWLTGEFCDRFLAMKARWSGIVNHQAELIETTSANDGYKEQLSIKARQLKTQLNIVTLARDGGDLSKDQRIATIEPRFRMNEVSVCTDTCTRTWVDEGIIKTIWDPEGYRDPVSHDLLPGGELVEQFIRFPTYPLKDIPDAIACIDATDRRTGQRHCFYRRPMAHVLSHEQERPKIGQSRQGLARGGGTMASFYARAARRIP